MSNIYASSVREVRATYNSAPVEPVSRFSLSWESVLEIIVRYGIAVPFVAILASGFFSVSAASATNEDPTAPITYEVDGVIYGEGSAIVGGALNG